ncbi:hypothetical protein DAEQUDRAFT_200078 [Daedalea quercina L-15889]|uniref:Uncharacterized protein n=1 Tax=Daedalea quercina L-15889 TaxID=1314783 RepID=A0A165U969_9APHY|nr:hypothetical protein DAEQUDRAFT_200078 [Daedalea quercina L-15889]
MLAQCVRRRRELAQYVRNVSSARPFLDRMRSGRIHTNLLLPSAFILSFGLRASPRKSRRALLEVEVRHEGDRGSPSLLLNPRETLTLRDGEAFLRQMHALRCARASQDAPRARRNEPRAGCNGGEMVLDECGRSTRENRRRDPGFAILHHAIVTGHTSLATRRPPSPP